MNQIIDAIIETAKAMPVCFTGAQRSREFEKRMRDRGYALVKALNDANAVCVDIEPLGKKS